MQNRRPTRVRRTFDTRRDSLAGRACRTWSPSPLTPNLQVSNGEILGISAHAQSLRVLVVDHDMRAASSLETLLHTLGCLQTHVAYTAYTATVMTDAFSPQVVLIELDMPEASSYGFGRTLRERAPARRMCLVAITDGREPLESARSVGCDRCLPKPITAQGLFACLNDAAGSV